MLNKPARPFVEIKKLNKKFLLNFPTIADEDRFAEMFGEQSWLDILKSGNIELVLSVFWQLLDDDCKRSVRDTKLVIWNGIEEKVVATDNPVERLKLLLGADELYQAAIAVNEARMRSLPDLKENEKKSPKAADR